MRYLMFNIASIIVKANRIGGARQAIILPRIAGRPLKMELGTRRGGLLISGPGKKRFVPQGGKRPAVLDPFAKIDLE